VDSRFDFDRRLATGKELAMIQRGQIAMKPSSGAVSAER